MAKRVLLAGAVWLACVPAAFTQTEAVDRYLAPIPDVRAKVEAGTLTQSDIDTLLPLAQPGRFVAYVRDSRQAGFESLIASLDSLRLNKLVASGAGGTSSTSLVSKVAVPAVIAAGIEYGGILRNTNAAVTTLRANLLGLANVVAGSNQFCSELNWAECGNSARWLRRLSGSVAFERALEGTTEEPDSVPVSELLSSNYRVNSWGFRVDLTGANNLDDPQYLKRWNKEIQSLGSSQEAEELTRTINDFFTGPAAETNEGASGNQDPPGLALYIAWRNASYSQLQGTTDYQEFRTRLAERLDSLVVLLREQPGFDFETQLRGLHRAHVNYFSVRDELLRTLHSHKASLEYTNERHDNEPTFSVIRFIYSHQPTGAPVVLTLNVAGSVYGASVLESTTSRFRSFQIAGQLDRRLRALPNGGHVVLTLAGHYEWIDEDAPTLLPTMTPAPVTGTPLPDEAPTPVGLKGHIGIVQGKVTLPLGDAVSVPLSVTFANRTELIAESRVRGQIGLTLDLDSFFR